MKKARRSLQGGAPQFGNQRRHKSIRLPDLANRRHSRSITEHHVFLILDAGVCSKSMAV